MTLLILILILGLLIFVHELGHFIFAKAFGVYVYEFALGMGPKIFSFRRKNKNDETLYSLRLFPIGGFCAMAGEVEEDDKKIPKDKFMCNKTKIQRVLILSAGVIFNFILAILLLFTQSLIWGHSEQKALVGSAPDNYPIAKAGIEVGDKVIGLNGYKVNSWDKLTIVLNLKHKSDIYEFKVEKKDGTIKIFKVIPVVEMSEEGTETTIFGIGQSDKVYKGVLNSIKYAFIKFGSVISSMFIIIISLFKGVLGISSLSGPVGMYSVVGESAKYGIQSLLYLTAYLSINLGFINGIPLPAFDGGRILFVVIEAISGKKVDTNIENTLHTIGFVLLMLLMLYITVQDVIKLF